MKRLLVVIIFSMFAIVLSAPSFAQEKTREAKEVKETSNKPVNSICPVSAEEVDGSITYEYEGKTYAVCCKSCLKKIKQDPEKYISRLSDDGKSIKKNKGDKK